MKDEPKRRWYRLHPLTWVVVLAAAGLLGFLQWERGLRIPGSVPGAFFAEGSGWPLARVRLTPTPAEPLAGVRAAGGHLANALAAAIVLVAVAAVVERIARNRDWDVLRLDRQVVFFLVAAALILAVRFHRLPHRFLMREELEHWVFDPFAGYLPRTAWAVWLIRPALVALAGCLLFVVVRVVVRASQRAVARWRRASPIAERGEAAGA